MNWGYFFAWVAVILGLFFVTGWPVSPELQGYWGNQYQAKSLTYYAVLYLHYILGALFFTFSGLGLVRNVIWNQNNNKGNKQLIFLLAWSLLAASVVAVVLTYLYAPDDDNQTQEDSNVDQDIMNHTDTMPMALGTSSTKHDNQTDL